MQDILVGPGHGLLGSERLPTSPFDVWHGRVSIAPVQGTVCQESCSVDLGFAKIEFLCPETPEELTAPLIVPPVVHPLAYTVGINPTGTAAIVIDVRRDPVKPPQHQCRLDMGLAVLNWEPGVSNDDTPPAMWDTGCSLGALYSLGKIFLTHERRRCGSPSLDSECPNIRMSLLEYGAGRVDLSSCRYVM